MATTTGPSRVPSIPYGHYQDEFPRGHGWLGALLASVAALALLLLPFEGALPVLIIALLIGVGGLGSGLWRRFFVGLTVGTVFWMAAAIAWNVAQSGGA